MYMFTLQYHRIVEMLHIKYYLGLLLRIVDKTDLIAVVQHSDVSLKNGIIY